MGFEHITKTQFDPVNARMEGHLKACLHSNIVDANGGTAGQLIDDEAINKSTWFNLLWTRQVNEAFPALPDLSCYVNYIDPKAHAAVLVTGHMPVRHFVYDKNGEPLEDMCLRIKVELKDGEWTQYWVQEEALTAGKKGGPTKVFTIDDEVCWAKPVVDDIGVFLTWSLAYRSRCDHTSFAPYTIRIRDPSTHTVLRVLTGLQAHSYVLTKREWTCQESARDELDVLFEKRCDKSGSGGACARAETLFHAFFWRRRAWA